MEVRWLRRALKNLDEEAEYIAHDNPEGQLEWWNE